MLDQVVFFGGLRECLIKWLSCMSFKVNVMGSNPVKTVVYFSTFRKGNFIFSSMYQNINN